MRTRVFKIAFIATISLSITRICVAQTGQALSLAGDTVVQPASIPHGLSQIFLGTAVFLAVTVTGAAWLYRLNTGLRQEQQERLRIETEFRQLQAGNRAVAENAPFAMVITRISDGKVIYINPAAETLFGVDRERTFLRPAATYWADPSDRAAMIANLKEHGADRRECLLHKQDGEPLWVLLSANRVNHEGHDAALIALMDIVERKAMEARLEVLAMTDYLTGLPNRRHFVQMGEEAIARIDGIPGGALSLLALDVDEFKSVNDTHGHAGGDSVLQHVAELLRDTLEEGEAAGRLGGEEFGILLPGSDAALGWERAEAIRSRIADSVIAADGSGEVRLSVSIGVATCDGSVPGTAENLGELLRRADKALYRAKSAGRNRVVAG